MNKRHIPNIISMFRVLLVLPVVWLLWQREYAMALLLFAIAGVSDALDGFLAKHYGWQSRLGSILDPLADKLLLVCCFLTLAWLELIPFWLLVVVIARDLVIVVGALIFHVLFGRYEMAPSLISKINTFFQIVFVIAVVLFNSELWPAPWIAEYLGYVVLATTLVSGADYIWVWGRRALEVRRRQ